MKFWQLGSLGSLGCLSTRIVIIITCSYILVTNPPLRLISDSKKKIVIRDNKLTPKNPSIQ